MAIEKKYNGSNLDFNTGLLYMEAFAYGFSLPQLLELTLYLLVHYLLYIMVMNIKKRKIFT